jgi:hypothetical protein
MKAGHWIALLTVFIGVGFVYSWVTNKDVGGRSFTGEITVHAKPAALWALLIESGKLSAISNESIMSGVARYAKIGDASQIISGADTGSLVVTLIKPSREIRFAFEPRNGSYACQQRWELQPIGDSTKVLFLERYTESGPEAAAQIEVTAKGYDEMLSRLGRMVEGKK